MAAGLFDRVRPFGPPGLFLLDLCEHPRLEDRMLGLAAASQAGLDSLADVDLVLVDETSQLPLRMADGDRGEDVAENLAHFEEIDLRADLGEQGVLLDVNAGRAPQDLGVAEVGHRGLA